MLYYVDTRLNSHKIPTRSFLINAKNAERTGKLQLYLSMSLRFCGSSVYLFLSFTSSNSASTTSPSSWFLLLPLPDGGVSVPG